MHWKDFFNLSSNQKVDQHQLENSDTFCMMPWVHLHVTQLGTVTPCCQTPWEEDQAFGNINKQTIDEIWHGEKMNAFRANMLKGKADSRCERCYQKERSGWKTLRKITNANYAHHLPRVNQTGKRGAIPNTKPVYFDLRFSNVCNYRCRICGPWSSSKWHKDGLALGMTDSTSAICKSETIENILLKQFEENIESVEEIYFAGGEPLMMDEHYKMLEILIKHDNRDVKLMYNTNFSTLQHKKWNVIELWNNFRHINLAASLDAMGARAELLRKEQSWSDIISNLKRLRHEAPHVRFMVSPTVYVFNVFHLFDFHRFMVDEEYVSVEDFVPTLLIQPEYYNIRVFPSHAKQSLGEKIDEHIIWVEKQACQNQEKKTYVLESYLGLKSHLLHADHSHLIPELKQKTQALDTLREEHTARVFPELNFLFSD